MLFITVLLTLAVILVNGWTDAPNAIATAVSTNALPFRNAVRLAAVCNFFGVVVVTTIHPSVAETIYSIADFGSDSKAALTALCAAMVSIILFSCAAWVFGIPTSESHALIAGVSGAAIALRGGLSNINLTAWGKVLWGLFLSVGLGFFLGGFFLRLLPPVSDRLYRRFQILGAAIMSFLHGAQDGQKFIGVFLLGVALNRGHTGAETFPIPFWLMALCAMTMTLGTAMGGKRIIQKVGRDMVDLNPRRGFSADLAGGICLLASTLLGLPVSTTHTKTAAILGAGTAQRLCGVNGPVARSIILTWLVTFPCCALIGWSTAKLFLFIYS